MPRQAGQIDQRKSEGILDAAAEAFAARGLEAPMEEIARRAGVSKQTIYNHYGSKDELLRALFDRRREAVIEPLGPLHDDEPLQDRIAAYVQGMLTAYVSEGYLGIMRSAVVASVTRAEVGRMVYDTGPRIGRARTAAFLAREAAAGRLAIPDADEAADVLFGMAVGATFLRVMLDVPVERRPEHIAARARDCAYRFVRAYAPG
ncbi:MAG: TetR/AcrR family transcriptional regulator [Hyphomonadaceae bacterium]|nr:TetR/AcrR family transcriptional regulator [Hyphomonadaceae bacterium]